METLGNKREYQLSGTTTERLPKEKLVIPERRTYFTSYLSPDNESFVFFYFYYKDGHLLIYDGYKSLFHFTFSGYELPLIIRI